MGGGEPKTKVIAVEMAFQMVEFLHTENDVSKNFQNQIIKNWF